MERITFKSPEIISRNYAKELVKIWLEDVNNINPTWWKIPEKKKELQKKYSFPKMMKRAKELLELTGNFADARWSIQNKKYYL